MINKTYHTFRTVPKYNDKQDIPHLQNSSIIPKYNDKQVHTTPSEQFLNIMINKTYHTFRTVPKYNDKQDIPHLHNSS